MKSLASLVVWLLLLVEATAGESLNFSVKPFTAGKALLSENGYVVERNLGIANFSPDLRMPIQLIYNSAYEKNGFFGFKWYAPQLESSAVYDKDGALWVTPWGEKIKFFAKVAADKETLELYKEEMKGRGFFAPYAEWEAETTDRNEKILTSGNWTFSGKRSMKGWRFFYRNAQLHKITAPSGRSLIFSYENLKLTAVSQDNQKFIELTYENGTAKKLTVNGVEYSFDYDKRSVAIMPKTEIGEVTESSQMFLNRFAKAKLESEKFSYDGYGYLVGIERGTFSEQLVVEHESIDERRENIQLAKANKFTGRASGRLLSDGIFNYKYNSRKPGEVELVNAAHQRAKYNYNGATGVFHITEFSGKSYTIYYFMRYDVAYLGKVRKIVDGKDRTVVSYRYDKLTGNILRVRDISGNDINFTYDKAGNLIYVSRRAAEQAEAEPVLRLQYENGSKPTRIIQLTEKSQPYQTSIFSYDNFKQPTYKSNGQNSQTIQYNRFGYPVAVDDTFKQRSTAEFDQYNRLISSTDIYGVKSVFSYNEFGALSEIKRLDGKELLTSLTIEYDDLGEVAAVDSTLKCNTMLSK